MYVLTEDEYKLFKQMYSEPTPSLPIPEEPKLNQAVQFPELTIVPSAKRTTIEKAPKRSKTIIKKPVLKEHKHINKYSNWLTL